MNLVRVGLVGLFCALVGTGVAAAANGSSGGGATSNGSPARTFDPNDATGVPVTRNRTQMS